MSDKLFTRPGRQINGLPGVPVRLSPALNESFGSYKVGNVSIS